MSADLSELTAQLQAQLETERERYAVLQATLESIADGILVISPQGQVLTYNQPFIRLWGISETLLAAEADPDECWQFLASQTIHADQFQSRVEEILCQPPAAEGATAARGDRWVLKDGRQLECRSQPQWLKEQFRGWVWSCREITEPPQQNGLLPHQVWRTVIDAVPNMIFVKDWEGRYLIANQAAAEFYNTVPENLVGKRDADFHPNSEIAEQFVQENRRVIETGEELFVLEEKVGTQPERDEWLQWQKRRIQIPGQDTYSVLGVGVRITERKRQEAALRLIVEGTAAQTGDRFFQTCVRYLAEALQVPYALLLEFCDSAKTRVRVLADYGDLSVNKRKEYSLMGTPCQNAAHGQMCFYPERVRDFFPNSTGLLKRNAESYLGIPLTDSAGAIVGHLVVMDTKAMQPDPGQEMILRIFAARAGAELERRSAEQALQESEQKFRSIFQNSQVGIGRTRIEDGLILEANQRLAEILGYESADQITHSLHTTALYVNLSDRQHVLSELEAAGGVHRDFELQLQRRDGSTMWGLLSLRLNAGENCLDFVLTDISDRKRLEAELRQSQQLLNSIVENIPLALFTKDVVNDFRYVQINKNSEKIVGFPVEQAIGQTDYDLLPQALADRYHTQDLTVVSQRSSLITNDEIVNANGQGKIFIKGRKIPLLNPQGEPTHLLCIAEGHLD
jgi:PAS domain S-box-containing protein